MANPKQVKEAMFQACSQGLMQGVFPGVSAACSLLYKKRRNRVFFSGGRTRLDALARPVQKNTVFDLASLTKALCTTPLCLYLLGEGELRLEDSAFDLLDCPVSADKKRISITHLLRHSSGLPAYKPFFQAFPPRADKRYKNLFIKKIAEQTLEYTPGSKSLYSDLGFILLGAIIEKKAGMSLDRFFRLVLTEPMGLTESLFFQALEAPSCEEKRAVAASEICPWREKTIQGEVHDEHCWLMGGVAGHAGLFGTAEAVLSLCELLLDIGKGHSSHAILHSDVVRKAFNSREKNSDWAMGFDRPSAGGSSSGRYFSANSLGHLGFTGTSFWIDLERECVVVLLSNRVHPSRDNTKIKSFRPFFHDHIMQKICSELEE